MVFNITLDEGAVERPHFRSIWINDVGEIILYLQVAVERLWDLLTRLYSTYTVVHCFFVVVGSVFCPPAHSRTCQPANLCIAQLQARQTVRR